MSSRVIEHCARHDYGRLVAVLTRRVGVRHIELVEDAVQSALVSALTTWTDKGSPEDPSAWLYKVAYHRLIQDLRQTAGRAKILEQSARDLTVESSEASASFPDEIHDDMLRMLFICCDEVIPLESRLVLALKTLCGFSTAEIALRLFTSEANVHKRLGRARERLRESLVDLTTPPLDELNDRLPGVHRVLYLLFNEGYLSADPEHAIRRELCDEALRLTTLLADHPVGAVPETFALLALMHLHLARFGSRVDATGGVLLLEEQDRSLWDRQEIAVGLDWLRVSARGEVFSRFHAEAGIAAEHCLAPSYDETRWDEIVDLYAMLERASPSPVHTLNRAIALAELRGPRAGLELLDGLVPPAWLLGSYLWDAVLSDLHRRAGNTETTARHRERALESAPTDAVRSLLARRLARGNDVESS
jgi:RNA polymerase sigma-70 factor (ECF subfamily)